MALATSLPRGSFGRSARIHASRSSTNGRLSSWRTARRSSALLPLIARSISNRAVDAPDGFQRQGRNRRRCLALGLDLGLAPRTGLDIGEREEWPARMRPARRLQDRAWRAIGQVQLVVAGEGIGLECAAPVREMRLRMLAPAVARIVEHRRRRRASTERTVIAHVNPTAPCNRLALGQNRHRRIIAMQALGGKDVGLDALEKRFECRATGADLIGQRRERKRHTLAPIALGLPVQRLVLAELLEQDHRQQVRAGPTSRA